MLTLFDTSGSGVPPFLIAVTGKSAGPQAFGLAIGEKGTAARSQPANTPATSVATAVPEGYTYQIDTASAMWLIAGQGCKVALGFEVGPYSSFGCEDPACAIGEFGLVGCGQYGECGGRDGDASRWIPSGADERDAKGDAIGNAEGDGTAD